MTMTAAYSKLTTGALTAFAGALALAAILLFASSAEAKFFDHSFPTAIGPGCGTGACTGTAATGGRFAGPRDIVVNDPLTDDGNGGVYDGWIYVADANNNRIQAFSVDDNGTPLDPSDDFEVFEFTIGRGVNQTAIDDDEPQAARNICTAASNDVCRGGATGSLGGEFNHPQGIDIDQQSGHFFVREWEPNRRVQEFEPDGSFVRAFGWDVVSEGTDDDTAADEFETCFIADECKAAGPAGDQIGNFGLRTGGGTEGSQKPGIALAPPDADNAGELFVADGGNRRVQRFTVPADPSEPVLPGAPFGDATVFRTSDQPAHLAVDAEGVVYASGAPSSSSVARYDSVADEFMSWISGGSGATALNDSEDVLGSGGVKSMEIDQGTQHLFVGRDWDVGIMEVDISGKPEEFGAARLVATHAAGLRIGNPQNTIPAMAGIGINPATGELFVSTQGTGAAGSGTGHRVLVRKSVV